MNSATPADSVAVAARSGSEITVPNESNGRIPFGAILPVRRAGWTAFETTWQGRIGWVSWSSVETPEVAARSVSTAIADAPSAALYETRALLFAHLGRIDAAVADYDSVFKLAPADGAAYCRRGISLRAIRRHELAIADFERAMSLSPRAAAPYFHRGNSRLAAGDVAGAAADFEAALERAPGDKPTRLNRALCAAHLRDDEIALGDCHRLIEATGPVTPVTVSAFRLRSLVRFRRGEYASALEDVRQALVYEHQRGLSYAYLALYRATCPEAFYRDPAEALKAAHQARRLSDPNDPTVLRALAAAAAESGDFDQAIQRQEESLALWNAAGYSEEGRIKALEDLQCYRRAEPSRDGSPAFAAIFQPAAAAPTALSRIGA